MGTTRAFACLLAASAITAVACSAPPPLRGTDTLPADTGAPVGGPAVDLSPVAAPANVLAKARAKNLGSTLRIASALVGSPRENADTVAKAAIGELIAGRRGLRLDVDAAAFSDQVALDAPVDVVVASDGGDVRVAFSLGLASLEGAKAAAGEKLAALGPGVWSLGGEKANGACAIMQSAGPVSTRLVCGPREADVAALGPYLVRTVSVEALPEQDIVADIDVGAIDESFGSTFRNLLPGLPRMAARRYGNGNPTYDKALEEGMRFLFTDASLLLEDVKQVHIEAVVDETRGIDLKLRTQLNNGAKSWFARTALASPSKQAPEQLWRGPREATGGLFGSVSDPAAFGDVTKALKGMVTGALEASNVGSAAERNKVAALVDLPLAKNATFVGLGGFDKLTKPAPAKTARDKQQQGFDQLMGWYVLGTNQKADAWARWMKEAVQAFNQPGLQKAFKAEMGKGEAITVKSVTPPKKLGKGAAAFELTFASKSDNTEGTMSVLIMPDGESSWFGVGFDREELVERLLRARDAKDPLSSRTDLATLRQGSMTAGAFMTLRSFRSSVFTIMMLRAKRGDGQSSEDATLAALRDTDAIFDALPKKGLAPMFVKTSAENNVLGLDLRMEKPVLDDASALVRTFTEMREPPKPPPPKKETAPAPKR